MPMNNAYNLSIIANNDTFDLDFKRKRGGGSRSQVQCYKNHELYNLKLNFEIIGKLRTVIYCYCSLFLTHGTIVAKI